MHWDPERLQGDFGVPPYAEELYPHTGDTGTDFDAFENANMADDPAHAATKQKLLAVAIQQWDMQPRPRSPRCNAGGQLQHGVRYYRGLVKRVYELSGPRECCQVCGNTTGCAHFTYGEDIGDCVLVNHDSWAFNVTGYISGSIDGVAPAPVRPGPPPGAEQPNPAG